MKDHIKILGWLYIVLGILGVLAGAVTLIVLLGTGLISGDEEAVVVLSIIGFIVAGLVTLISAPGILAGVGLLKYKSWGRVLALILGFLNLPGFPIGTALGAYTIWVLLNDEASELFAGS